MKMLKYFIHITYAEMSELELQISVNMFFAKHSAVELKFSIKCDRARDYEVIA